MLKALLCLPLAFLSATVFAFDRWVDDTYKSGETIYSTGIAQVLLVGARGVGIAINPNVEGHVISNDVSVTIDDKPPVNLPIQHVAITTYLLKGDKSLTSNIAAAKKIQISYNICHGTANACAFTYKGIEKTAVWEFDNPLVSQFKDYQQKIQ